MISVSGGIGIHDRLKICCRKDWEFKSLLAEYETRLEWHFSVHGNLFEILEVGKYEVKNEYSHTFFADMMEQ